MTRQTHVGNRIYSRCTPGAFQLDTSVKPFMLDGGQISYPAARRAAAQTSAHDGGHMAFPAHADWAGTVSAAAASSVGLFDSMPSRAPEDEFM